jgi:hypothetical protein
MEDRDVSRWYCTPSLACYTAGPGSATIRTPGFCAERRAVVKLPLAPPRQESVPIFKNGKESYDLGRFPHGGVRVIRRRPSAAILNIASAVTEVSLDSRHWVTIPNVDLDAT